MKQKLIFFPCHWVSLFLNINGFKRLQPLTLEWLYRPAVPKLDCGPNLSLANIPRLSSFQQSTLFSSICSTDRHRQAVSTLKICNSGCIYATMVMQLICNFGCSWKYATLTLSWVFQKYFNFVPMLESRNVDHMKSDCSWDMFLWKNSGRLRTFMNFSKIFQLCTHARIT